MGRRCRQQRFRRCPHSVHHVGLECAHDVADLPGRSAVGSHSASQPSQPADRGMVPLSARVPKAAFALANGRSYSAIALDDVRNRAHHRVSACGTSATPLAASGGAVGDAFSSLGHRTPVQLLGLVAGTASTAVGRCGARRSGRGDARPSIPNAGYGRNGCDPGAVPPSFGARYRPAKLSPDESPGRPGVVIIPVITATRAPGPDDSARARSDGVARREST
jgi:hypothetical protein